MPEVVQEKRALILRPKTPELLDTTKTLAGKFQEVPPYGLAVPHNNTVFTALSNVYANLSGFEPIRYYYEWPKIMGQYDPWEHQKSTAAFICTYKRGFVLNEQRTGKTNATIWAIDYMRRTKQCGGVLVLTTKSTVRAVWEQSIFQLFPQWRVYSVLGDRAAKRRMLGVNGDVYIANHDSVRGLFVEYMTAITQGRIDTIVIDEVATFSDPGTTKVKKLKSLCDAAQRVYGLTGTPTGRGGPGVFAQVKIVNPSRLTCSAGDWKDRVEQQVAKYKWVPRHDAHVHIAEALKPAIKFTQKDIGLNTEKQYVPREVPLTKEQASAINEIKKEGALLLQSGGVITAVNAAVLVGKILGIAAGAVKKFDLDGRHIGTEQYPSNRGEALVDLVEETDGGVLVLSHYHAVSDYFIDELRKAKITSLQVDGRVTGRERDRRFKAFEMGECRVLVANPITTAHGLDFAACGNTIVWANLSGAKTPELWLQANARMSSAKQTRGSVGVYELYSTTIEREIFKALHDGSQLGEKILTLLKDYFAEGDGHG
jgi:superfamily II DNA or RNA helicase